MTVMQALSVQDPVRYDLDTGADGYWRLLARGRSGRWHDITRFRGIPTQLSKYSFADPFGPRDFSFTVPNVSVFDMLGVGDLDWADEEMRVLLEWHEMTALPTFYASGYGNYAPIVGALPNFDGYQNRFISWGPKFRWRGNLVSRSRSSDGLALTCKGAIYQLDDYLAKPEYIVRPLPYEIAIGRAFRRKPHLRIGHLKIAWPSWWSKTFEAPPKKTPHYLVPAGIHPGQLWTALLTRETGHWDPVLSSYIQSLLSSMYTARGRFTIDMLEDGPVLLHRDMYTDPPSHTVVIDPVAPGFEVNLSEDFSQSLGVVYASGQSLDGVTYSGMEVTTDGSGTYYVPAASRRELEPTQDNDWLEPAKTRREVMLQMQHGLDQEGAELVAREHLRRFGDPGATGTVVLRSDPMINGERVNKMLVKAGMPVHIPGLLGRKQGLLAHITENECDFDEDSNTLTIDTKFRDALTVREVRLRGRDAMQIPRMLVAGQYNPPIPDQLVPWDYSKGSGFIPSGKDFSSVPLFDGAPADLEFPWQSWTRRRPPKHPRWADCYMRVGPATRNANNNWGYIGGGGLAGRFGFPVRAAQMATIRLIELAAFDGDGNVMPVAFHFSMYYVSGTSVMSMPRIPGGQGARYPSRASSWHYDVGQHYPFGKDAWERYKASGELQDPSIPQPATTNGFVRAFGTFYDKAGYFPGSYRHGDAPTGMLRDETQFSIDTTQLQQAFNPSSKHQDATNKYAGMIYAMIYCDEQGDQPVYFAGRMYRVEPGQGQG